MRRQSIFIFVSVLVSAFFLWLALRDVPFSDILTRLQQADPFWVLVAFLTMSLGLLTRAVRWRGLLDARLSVLQAFHILNIGFLLNNLPLRAGEVARVLLATRAGVPVLTAATSVVVERLMDTFIVVVLLIFAITQLPSAPPEITTPTTLFGVAVVIAFAVLIFFARYPALARRVLTIAERLIPPLKRLPLEKLLDNVLTGLKPLTHLQSGLRAALWTAISWGVSFTTIYALTIALNLPEDKRFLVALLSLTLASFSIAIPASIAAVGPFEAAVRVAGQSAGVSDALALSLGFLFHGVNVFGYVVWGVVGLLALGVSVGDVLRGTQKQ